MSSKKQGFASLPEDRRREIAALGGATKNPRKGFGSKSKEELRRISSEAAKARWDRVRAERQEQDDQAVSQDTE